MIKVAKNIYTYPTYLAPEAANISAQSFGSGR
jgi:hypothetical protein